MLQNTIYKFKISKKICFKENSNFIKKQPRLL